MRPSPAKKKTTPHGRPITATSSSRKGARLELATVGNAHHLGGAAALRANLLNVLDHVHAIDNVAKHDVLAVQPGGLDGRQEELGAVGVRPGIGHGEHARAGVLQGEVLVGKLLAIDTLAARAVLAGEV